MRAPSASPVGTARYVRTALAVTEAASPGPGALGSGSSQEPAAHAWGTPMSQQPISGSQQLSSEARPR